MLPGRNIPTLQANCPLIIVYHKILKSQQKPLKKFPEKVRKFRQNPQKDAGEINKILYKKGNRIIFNKKEKGRVETQRSSGRFGPFAIKRSPFDNSIPQNSEKSTPNAKKVSEKVSTKSPKATRRSLDEDFDTDTFFANALENGGVITHEEAEAMRGEKTKSQTAEKISFQQGLASCAILTHSSSSLSCSKIFESLSTDSFTTASPMVFEQPTGAVPAYELG